MNPLIENETRKPIGFATYPGDVVEAITRDAVEGKPFGPNYMGEVMHPVTAEHDPVTNKTRVGFSLMGALTKPEQSR